MKKFLILAILSTSVFAASDLVNEFTRRRSLPQSQMQRAIYNFLRQETKDPANIRKFELLNNRGKFALKMNNDDVCFGDIETESLQCFNVIGLRTYFAKGDLD